MKTTLHFLAYQIFREVVGLERGPLSLVSTIEKVVAEIYLITCFPTTNVQTLEICRQ
jgi:hypothetical protein